MSLHCKLVPVQYREYENGLFNKYEVLDMLEILHNKAADGNHDKKYHRLVYQTAREKVDSSKDHFKDLVMRLLGDKDHE